MMSVWFIHAMLISMGMLLQVGVYSMSLFHGTEEVNQHDCRAYIELNSSSMQNLHGGHSWDIAHVILIPVGQGDTTACIQNALIL